MEATSLLSLPEGMLVNQIQVTENGLVIEVAATSPTSCCPLCSQPSSSIHGHYRRTLRDAPCAGRCVQFVLTVRKFSCRNPECSRKVFAERFPTFVEPRARMTIRHCQQITSIGLATCGNGGTRLAARLGIQTTRQTILRRSMALPEAWTGSVLFLGIDDFAFRGGSRFGTILVNLETHKVVDLLPDRAAETAAAWMRQQPDIFVVSRDRGGEYARVRIVDEIRRIRKIGFAVPYAQQRACTPLIRKVGFAAMVKTEARSRHDLSKGTKRSQLNMLPEERCA